LETSDVVTLHVPLTSDTENMIGRAQLARMKSSAVLINTARGAVVDESALIEALQEGQILGAGLDATTEEPPAPDNPLRTMENVILTPHVGGSIETMQRVFELCWQNIQDVLDGREPRNVVSH
jgi:glycerate dehydrogenase